jgi:hypothetical protein
LRIRELKEASLKLYCPNLQFGNKTKYYYFYTGSLIYGEIIADFLDIIRYSGNLVLVELTNKEKARLTHHKKYREMFKSVISGFGQSFYSESQMFLNN